ncbi:MAG: hypothetical protein AAB875_03300 [Patescibacteria group bacterium]
MVLERLRSHFGPRQASDSEKSAAIFDRISRVFWLLANNPRASRAGPTWDEISPDDLQILGDEEIKYLGSGESDLKTRPWVYSNIEGNAAFVAIGLGAKRVKLSVNGERPQLIQETRVDVGVWEEGEKREVSWELIEKVVSFVEQVPQRRLLAGSGSS